MLRSVAMFSWSTCSFVRNRSSTSEVNVANNKFYFTFLMLVECFLFFLWNTVLILVWLSSFCFGCWLSWCKKFTSMAWFSSMICLFATDSSLNFYHLYSQEIFEFLFNNMWFLHFLEYSYSFSLEAKIHKHKRWMINKKTY